MPLRSRFAFAGLLFLATSLALPGQEMRLQKEGTFLYPPNLTLGPDHLILGMTIGRVKGHPVSGTIDAENTRIDKHGQTIVTHYRSRIFRDSAGRTRIEWTITPLEHQPDPGRDMIEIYDPATRITIHIAPSTKTATESYIPRPEEMEKYACDPKGWPQIPPKILDNLPPIPTVSQVELAHTAIDGRKVRHGRETLTTLSQPPATSIASSQVTDYWFSQELQYFVLVKRSGPGKSRNVIKLSEIRGTEPDAALFTIPEGYSVSEPLPPSRHCAPAMMLGSATQKNGNFAGAEGVSIPGRQFVPGGVA